MKNVSASFGRQIARGAILAIIVSLLLIVGYISLRFQWKFAVPVLVALAHDVLITIGIYALLGREVTTATVAAVLTVLGYSIYDTIIIFDRIRENIPLMKRAPFRVDRERLALGDDPALAGDDLHHARADRLALALRRRHAQGLRVRAARRHRRRRLLVDLHRRAAPRDLQGARAGVRPPPRRRARRRRARSAARCSRRRAAPRSPSPRPRRLLRRRRSAPVGRAGDGVELRRPRPQAPAPERSPAARPRALSATALGLTVRSKMGGMSAEPDDETRSVSEILLAGIGFATLGRRGRRRARRRSRTARRCRARLDARGGPGHAAGVARRGGRSSAIRRDEAFERAYAQAGLARREEIDDLALRVAQLEHRIRLLEHDPRESRALSRNGHGASPSAASAGRRRSAASRRGTASAICSTGGAPRTASPTPTAGGGSGRCSTSSARRS